jgi:hypothetical protein
MRNPESKAFLESVRWARRLWPGQISAVQRGALAELYYQHKFSVRAGDLLLLQGHWYVTHAGLIRLARRSRCFGIHVNFQRSASEPAVRRWVFRATVYKSGGSKCFVGFGDADPSNVSALVQGAEMRVAETRAVNRALRKAYGIALCSVEELGYAPSQPEPSPGTRTFHADSSGNGNDGHVRLRDRLCLLIRQHQLDPSLVKRYAAHFCGTPELRDATREQVEFFITHIAEWATKDRDGLVCKLNSFGQAEEVRP